MCICFTQSPGAPGPPGIDQVPVKVCNENTGKMFIKYLIILPIHV